MEMAENERKYGVRDTTLNITTRVACHLAKGESNELTKKWIEEHDKLDAQREAREKAAQREAVIQK